MKKFILILLVILTLCHSAFGTELRGDIEIPCLNIKMPFFSTDKATTQNIIDEEQSALFSQWQQASRITDHAFSEDENGNQWNIQKIFTGAYAIIKIDGKKYFYECYMTAKTDYKYNQEFVNNRLITPSSSYDIMLCCCAENSDHHFIAILRRISEIK